LLLLLLGGCDDRCNIAACTALFQDCGGVLKAEPHYARCGLRRDDETDRPFKDDRNYRCAQACVASNSGRALECIEEKANTCDSASSIRILNSCSDPVPDAMCRQKCDDARETCESACPGLLNPTGDAGVRDGGGDKATCLDCVARCGLAWGRCDVACRGDHS
jgi:hypothetical protein